MEDNSIGFTMTAIKAEQFAVFENQFSEKKKVELNAGFKFRLNRENKRIGVFSTFQFEQAKQIFIKLEVSCHFEIKENSWNDFISENGIRIPVGFARHLSMLTVGTARGILHCKTEGTMFNTFLLPAINVTQIVTKDVVFK